MKRGKKIVLIEMTITYDDGAKRKLKGSDIYAAKRYVSSLCVQDGLHELSSDPAVWATVTRQADKRQAVKLKKRETKSKKLRLPRNPVTKADLIAFRDKYYFREGTKRGWQTAACRKFLIDPKTLKKRMAE